MVENIDKENFKKYFFYVKEIVEIQNSRGVKLVYSNLEKIKVDDIQIEDITKICKMVQFLQKTEKLDIYLYHEWYRHIR
jgi:hypothetical protein